MAEGVEVVLKECNATFPNVAVQALYRMQKPVGPFRNVRLTDGSGWLGEPAEIVPGGTEEVDLDQWLVVDPSGHERCSLVYAGMARCAAPFTHTLRGGDVFVFQSERLLVQNITRKNVVASIDPVGSTTHRMAVIPLARVCEIFPIAPANDSCGARVSNCSWRMGVSKGGCREEGGEAVSAVDKAGGSSRF
jgi:hypothetical protein